MSQTLLYPLRFEPIYQYRLWGGRRLAGLLTAPLPGDGPIGEAWVVLEARPRSRVYAGLQPGTTEVGLRQALTNGAVADRLACFTPKPGDAVFLPAGTVHALGGDIVVFEVQQNSDVTFRLYDWDHVDAKTGQPRALQVDQALACIDFAQGNAGLVAPVVVGKTPVEPLMPPEKATCFCCLRLSGRVRFSREAR